MLRILGDENIPLVEAISAILDIAADAQESIDMPFPDNEANDSGDALSRIFGCFEELGKR